MRFILTNLAIFSSAVLLIGCGKSSGSSNDDNPGLAKPSPGPTSGALTDKQAVCEGAWKSQVASHPKGLVQEYETTVQMDLGQTPGVPGQKSSETIEVIDSSVDQIQTKVTVGAADGAQSITTTETKTEFMDLCLKAVPNTIPQIPGNVDPVVKVLEQREESKTVRAGTFLCQYMKISSQILAQGVTQDAMTQTWTDPSIAQGLLVMMVTESQGNAGGFTMKSTTTRELVRLVKP